MANPQKENGFIPISSEIYDAFCKMRIPGEARQMLDAIIRKTYGYHKKEDQISTSQFTQLTGLPKFTIQRARKRLLAANLITVSKNATSQILTYSFQKDYTKWVQVAKKLPVVFLCNSMQKSTQTVAVIASHNRYINTITIDNGISDFLAYYNLKTKKHFHLTPLHKNLIGARLKDYTLEQLKSAVDNFIQDPWEGRKDRLDLVYCIGIRNKIDNLEKWLNWKPQETRRVVA